MAGIQDCRWTNCHGGPNGSNENQSGSASRNVPIAATLATHRMTSSRRRSTKRSPTAPASGVKRINDSTATSKKQSESYGSRERTRGNEERKTTDQETKNKDLKPATKT